MRRNVITVSAVCVGLVTALFGTNFFLNYREMQTNELLSLWSAIALLLYGLGIYTTVTQPDYEVARDRKTQKSIKSAYSLVWRNL